MPRKPRSNGIFIAVLLVMVTLVVIFYSGMGLLSRLMPQLNIFFLSLPLQIYLGLGLLFMTVPIIIVWFTRYYENGLMKFVR